MAEISKLNNYDIKDKKAIRYYNTVADMKADTTLKSGMYVKTKGYYYTNDGGGADYIIVESQEQDKYYEELNNELYSELIIKDGAMNVKQFGAYGDGIHDNSTILNTIFSTYLNDNQTLFIPQGTYKCESKIEINDVTNVVFNFDGILNSENGVILNNLYRCQINNLKIIRDYTKYDYTSLHNIGLEFKNSKYLTINSVYVAGFEYGYYWHSVNSSNSYNDLYDVHSFDNLHAWFTLNEGSGFTNEIKVFGGRFSLNTNNVDVSGIADYITIPNNTNMHCFIGVCLEGAFTKINCAGSYNSFINCRLEYQDSNNRDVVFSGNNNTIFACYLSEQQGGTSIIDNGRYNKIDMDRRFILNKVIPENTEVITSDYSLSQVSNNILCDCTNKNITVTLPLSNVNHINSIIKIRKIDVSDNYVSLLTAGQSYYDYIGRGALLKNINDYVDVYWDGVKWTILRYGNIYEDSLSNVNESNLIEGLNYKEGINNKIIAEGGTISNAQITNTYCDTTADSPDIIISISGTSNRTLRLGNYITIDTEPGYFKIIKLDLTLMTATLNRNVTQSLSNKRIKYHYPVKKYLGLIYDKVDTLPATGNEGDIVFYNTPTPGGYIGAIYTSSGWKNFGEIES